MEVRKEFCDMIEGGKEEYDLRKDQLEEFKSIIDNQAGVTM